VALSQYALITVAELKAELRGGHANETSYDSRLEDICEIASDEVERALDRLVVSRGPITAYFSVPLRTSDIYFRQWPLISVTSIHEDTTRVYGADTALVANTDYLVSAPAHGFGYVTRIAGATSGVSFFLTGRRAVRVVYTAGYADTASVPLALKQVTLELAKLIYLESQKAGSAFLSQETSPMGNVQRWTSAIITRRTDDALSAGGFKRPEMFWEYEERTA